MPSRLIGKEVQVRLYADRVEVYYKGHLVDGMARVHGEREANVNYHHVIGSSRPWPGAGSGAKARSLRPLPLQGATVPHHAFPASLRRPRKWSGERADVEYVRILHLAATTMEATVGSALALLLEAGGEPFDYTAVGTWRRPGHPRPRRSR